MQQGFDLENFGSTLDAFVDLPLRQTGHTQSERKVLFDSHLRVKRVGLKHHADASVLWLIPRDISAFDEDAAFGNIEKTSHAIEQRGLSATGRPKKHEKLAFPDFQIEILQHIDRPEAKRQVLDGNA